MKDEKLLLEEIESIVERSVLITASKYLNLEYSVFSSDEQLWDLVKKAFGTEKLVAIFDGYKVFLLANRFINELLLKYYPSERIAKYAIANSLKSRPDTVLFEMPVLGSRVDVCRINGSSYAYEIKTELDTFRRLKKQIDDYSKVFEYVNIIVPKELYEGIHEIPDYCGIYLFGRKTAKAAIKIWPKRKALKSPHIDPNAQLQCLSIKELGILLKNRGIKEHLPSKESRCQYILSRYSAKTINYDFKRLVKSIYRENWDFIKQHYDTILPIDMQAFFSSPIEPSMLYYKN